MHTVIWEAALQLIFLQQDLPKMIRQMSSMLVEQDLLEHAVPGSLYASSVF